MTFTWPLLLPLLLLAPALAGVYVWVTRRRATRVLDAGLHLTDAAPRAGLLSRRNVPPALFLLALALLLFSLSRPSVVLALPHLEGTVILAFDVSGSMRADDLKPTRMDAAKAAAAAFVERQPRTVRVGVVAFSDSSFAILKPTDSRDEVLAAIDRLAPSGGTSLTEGMFGSLSAISGKPIPIPEDATEDDILSIDIGHHSSSVIVLLSDGEHTTRLDPVQVAELAAGAGVRIYPIGLGSPRGATLEVDGYHVQTTLNEELLVRIAETTEGTYLRAEDEAQLVEVYENIDLQLTTRGEDTEITSYLAGAAILLMTTGAALSILWFGRVP